MQKKEEQIKQLYKDAMYSHLLCKGRSFEQAIFLSERMIKNKKLSRKLISN